MEDRCNFLYDCTDRSDELSCEIVSIENEKYQKIFPPVSNGTKTDIFVSIDVLSITHIDEMARTFTSRLKLYFQWRDQRITFNNLSPHGNFLRDSLLDHIWLPPLYFSNSKGWILITGKEHITVNILRQGPPYLNQASELNEGKAYRGDENDLSLIAYHQLDFDCIYELSHYPFDIQKCSIDIKVADQFRQYITLMPKKINFLGKS